MRLNCRSMLLSPLLCAALFLGACTAIQPVTPEATPAETSAVTPAVTPEETDTPQAEEEPDTTPTEMPTEMPTEEAGEEPQADGAGVDIGELVRQVLMQQLQVDADEIEIVSVEEVEWPDSCLGVYTADELCAQVITPGYRVVLEVNGDTYEYHTDAEGMAIRLAEAPQASIEQPLILFEARTEGCTTAQIGTTGVAYGPCGGVQMMGQLVVPERADQLAELVSTFAPFTASTQAGSVDFYGAGTTEATPAQQRMIAEWSRNVLLEAESGRSGASWGLAFAWHREGGIAGFCEDVTAYVTGQLYITSCRGQTPETIEARWLTAEELEQIYAWQDRFAPFEMIQSDNAQADSMTVRLVFSSSGDTEASAADQQAIADFAADLFAQATQ